MIRRLRVRGYKSLRDSKVDLNPVSVLLGPNAAGKSNLLDLLGLLSASASSETLRQAFQGHRGRPLEAFHAPDGFSKERYEQLLRKDRVSFRVECDLELHPRIVESVNSELERRQEAVEASVTYTKVSEPFLRYILEVAMHPASGELFVEDESLRALKKDLSPKADTVRKPFFEKEAAAGKPRFVARVERQGHPRFFEPRRPRTLLSELSDPVYHPHVVATAREISSWRVYYVEPTRMRAEVAVQAASDPGRAGELLAAYYYALQEKHPATLKSIVKTLREFVGGLDGLRVDVREGLLEIVAELQGGVEFPARLLSEGTLRLLCVLGIAVTPWPAPSVVVYEEPENGVNPARLDLIAEVVKTATRVRPDGPQMILTTHSPLVCELLPEHLVICSSDPRRGTEFVDLPWRRDSLFFGEEVVRALSGVGS